MNNTLCFITFLAQQVQKIQSQMQKSHEEMLRAFTTSLAAKNKTTKEVSILQEQFAREKDTYDKTIADVKARRELIAAEVVATMTLLREETNANELDSITYTGLVNAIADLKRLVRRRGDAEHILEELDRRTIELRLAQDQVAELTKALDVKSHELIEAQKTIENLHAGLEARSLELEDAMFELAKRKGNVQDEKTRELNRVETLYKTLKKSFDEIQLELEGTRGSLADANQQLDANKSCVDALDEKTRELNRVETLYKTLKKSFDEIQLELEGTRGSLARVEDDLKVQTKLCTELESQKQNLLMSITDLSLQLEEVRYALGEFPRGSP
jgi:DNA repair exonuclease SbcCD ATPase subunit